MKGTIDKLIIEEGDIPCNINGVFCYVNGTYLILINKDIDIETRGQVIKDGLFYYNNSEKRRIVL